MLLTVGTVQIGTLQRFIIDDYDNDRDSNSYGGRDSFVAIAAKELEKDFWELAEYINENFNGVQAEGYYLYRDEIYFYNIKDAIRAKKWLESQLVAKRLMGKGKLDKYQKSKEQERKIYSKLSRRLA